LLKKWAKKHTDKSNDGLLPKSKDKNLNFVEEMIEKHLKTTMRSEGDVDREIYLLLSLSSNVEVDQIRGFWKMYSKQMPTLSLLAKSVEHSHD